MKLKKEKENLFLILLAAAVFLAGVTALYVEKKPKTETLDSQTQALEKQEKSDETSSIEKNLKATDFSQIDKELEEIEVQLQ